MPIPTNKATKLSGVKSDGTRLKSVAARTTPPQLRKHENKPLKLTIQREPESNPTTTTVQNPEMSKSCFDLNLEDSDNEDWTSSANPIGLSQSEPTGLPGFGRDEKQSRLRSTSVNSASSDAAKQPTIEENSIRSSRKEETGVVDEKKTRSVARGSNKAAKSVAVESGNLNTRRKVLSHGKKKRLDSTKKSITKAAPLVINSDSEVEEVENSQPVIVKDLEGIAEESNMLKGKRRATTEQKCTKNARGVVEEDELGVTVQKDVDFPFEPSSSQRSRKGQKKFGGKSQKRDLDRRKKEKADAEQIMKSSQLDDSGFIDYEKTHGILKKVDDSSERQKREKVQKLEEWRNELETKDFIDKRDMLSVAQAINIDLPDDLLAEIASSQARDCDSSQDNPTLKRKRTGNGHDIDLTMFDFQSDPSQRDYKCPICQLSVSSNLYNSYGTQALKKSQNQQQLHISHEKEWAFRQKAEFCIPDIDWDLFEQRCRSHFDFLAKLMKGNTDTTSHYRQEYTRLHTKKRGKDKTKNDFASGNWDQTVPGYYGPYGSMRMSDLIMESNLIKHTFTGKIDQCSISAGEYSVSILVPELGIQLIMEDMNISNYYQGLKFMIDTIKIGQILNSVATHEDDGDDHNHNLSDDDDDNYGGGGKAKADLLNITVEDDGELDWKQPIEIDDDDNDAGIPDEYECDEWIHGVDETTLAGDDGDDNGAESQYVG